MMGTGGSVWKVAHSHGGQVGSPPRGPLHRAASVPQDIERASLPTEVTHCHSCGILPVTQTSSDSVWGGDHTMVCTTRKRG